MYDLIIIGSGAAGLAASIYAGRYRMKTLLIEGEFGGETSKAGEIANYPGVMPIDGYELMKTMKEQGKKVGAEFKDGFVKNIKREGHCFSIQTEKELFQSKAVIFAGGAEHRRLGLANEDALTGRGVHYCMTCDGPIYTDKTIAMVGGGDSSVKSLNLGAEYFKKAYLITMEKDIHAEPINLEHLKEKGDKIEVLTETQVKEIVGDKKLEKIILTRPFKGSGELLVDGLFVEIGFKPNVALPQSIGVELDEKGYIKVDSMMKTNIDGFFAAGDTVNHFGRFKQDITAAAMGTVAATSAYEDVKTHGANACEFHAQIIDK
ncbi:MAG: FAD-dependent oxidoreductase [Parcubacteria group bacterium]|nr:FAD-dependent oxidoreductase [Parcubacteria group bacterium]